MQPTRDKVIQWANEVGIDVPSLVFDSERIEIEFQKLFLFAVAAISTDREEAMQRSRSIILQAEERGRTQALDEAAELARTNGIDGIPIHGDEIVADWLQSLKGKQ